MTDQTATAQAVTAPNGVKGVYVEPPYPGGPAGGRKMLHTEGILEDYLINREDPNKSIIRPAKKEGGSPYACGRVEVDGLGTCLLVVSTNLICDDEMKVKPSFAASKEKRDFGVYTVQSQKTGKQIRLAKFILGSMNIDDEQGLVDKLIATAEQNNLQVTVAQN